ncbi:MULTISPECIES: hypothetical protein [unclassified Novosphingobium]|uniref:hypothetical protein n=1 Tax=unclassified Novosphingobium TaxID=2644732 RepID=UPI0014943139|nr:MULTISPECIES: hypothetical protein [unclassified Novosphingobium]MBB3358333.1 hypothetical protein [Novosphingobium sp. BK256]MBB3374694.1 hypothetical protein [Novosphingobium sp. BK280]MBB3379106.1 hypothetical protein [Novosphingobium sp. BK258]MBB3420800.1 hypothetical protein [Novosphingobium sp. BK267]MBB3448078.1 hypothetical protein [Novosphingobium sp. BK352]
MTKISIASLALAGAMALATMAPLQAEPAASCDRACLTAMMESYIDAIPTHDRAGQPIAAGTRETVNGRVSPAQSDYFWKLVDGITYRQILADPSTGQVAMLGVATEAGGRGAYWLRLAVKNRQITEIEQVIGDRPAGGVPGLAAPNPYFEQILPEQSRSTRAQLIAIADSYFEGLQRHDGAGVQSALGCRRYENGNQTSLNPLGNTWACNVMSDYTYMDKIKERRFPIVDVERGIVVGAMVIEVSKPKASAAITGAVPGGPQSVVPLFSRPHDTLIQEVFKIADGKIQEINVIRQDMPYQWGSGW